jgi:geranylgeranyl pyrophosphate synthase
MPLEGSIYGSDPLQRWVSELIQPVLGTGKLGEAYHQQLQEFIDRSFRPITDEPTLYSLPVLACQASGGDPRQVFPIVAAWQLLLLTIELLDDIEDHELVDNVSVVTNTTTGLLVLTQLVLGELLSYGVPADRVRQITLELQHVMLRGCAGQHADLLTDPMGRWGMDPDTWLEIARAKSGEFFAWAVWAGAIAVEADEAALAGFRDYGYHLGALIQVADDYNDIWTPYGISDLANGRPNLPICYALLVTEGAERIRLESLLTRASEGDSEAEAQVKQMLIDLGAQTYLLVVARTQHQLAVAALERAVSASSAVQPLRVLLDHIFPVISFDTQRDITA